MIAKVQSQLKTRSNDFGLAKIGDDGGTDEHDSSSSAREHDARQSRTAANSIDCKIYELSPV